jgi:hypothetical protein
MEIEPHFRLAVDDYFYLLNRDYPERAILKVIGDRYHLSRSQRHILFRGVAPRVKAMERKARLTADICRKSVFLDGYNVLITVMNYLYGKILFISNDGMLRDVGENYGKIRNKELFRRSCLLVMEVLRQDRPSAVTVFLDSPVSHSAIHKLELTHLLEEYHLEGEIVLSRSPDYELKHLGGGCIATSDSVIMDGTGGDIVDLPHRALAAAFDLNLIDLGQLIEQN